MAESLLTKHRLRMKVRIRLALTTDKLQTDVVAVRRALGAFSTGGGRVDASRVHWRDFVLRCVKDGSDGDPTTSWPCGTVGPSVPSLGVPLPMGAVGMAEPIRPQQQCSPDKRTKGVLILRRLWRAIWVIIVGVATAIFFVR